MSWYSRYGRSGQELGKMSLSRHLPTTVVGGCSLQVSRSLPCSLSSPLPLLPLIPTQRSRMPGVRETGARKWKPPVQTPTEDFGRKGHDGLISFQGTEALTQVPDHGDRGESQMTCPSRSISRLGVREGVEGSGWGWVRWSQFIGHGQFPLNSQAAAGTGRGSC